MTAGSGNHWDVIIRPKKSLFRINPGEVWSHRDLLMMLVWRDIVTVYKQTILGPVWYFMQPVLTMIIFIIIFNRVARLPTDGIPPALFYLSGIIMWNYFADSFVQTSDVFYKNADLFGKIYFPRIIIPLTQTISGLIKFFIQLMLFLLVYLYYLAGGVILQTDIVLVVVMLPYLVLLMAILGLGAGIICSSLTTKYRDLTFLINFGVQLLMFATPIIYPMSMIPEKYLPYLQLNPLSHIVEAWKYCLFGAGQISGGGLLYATVFGVLTLLIGVVIFNRTEQTFMDTV